MLEGELGQGDKKHGRKKEDSRSHPHVTNQEITDRPSVINSVVLDHATKRREGTVFLPFFVVLLLLSKPGPLIDSLVTRDAISKNSELTEHRTGSESP